MRDLSGLLIVEITLSVDTRCITKVFKAHDLNKRTMIAGSIASNTGRQATSIPDIGQQQSIVASDKLELEISYELTIAFHLPADV